MNEIMTFESEEFGQVRTLQIKGETWWILKDICRVLEMRENRAGEVVKRLDEDEYDSIGLTDSIGRTQKMYIVNEAGVYSILVRSDKPRAIPFRKWITNVVIPTIRKTGGYVNDAEKFVNTYLPFADEPTKNLFKIQFEYINQLNDRIRRDEPKVKFADHVSGTVNLIDMNDMAKLCADHGIRIGRTRLFRWLRYKGILMEDNIPYQEYIERGYFKVKESVFEMHGEVKTHQQTMVTGRGQQYVLARLMREYGSEVVNA